MALVETLDQIESKRKALVALFPYAVRWEQGGDHRLFDTYLCVFGVPGAREVVGRPIVMLLDEASPNSPNWLVTLVLPYAEWESRSHPSRVTGWARAALAVPYTEGVGQSVVDTLLQIAPYRPLQPYIPADVWAFLKKQPVLPPICDGRRMGTADHVVRRVRELGGAELLESYFLLVWSEWHPIYPGGLAEMRTSIRQDFGGIGMWRHLEVLIKRLDHVLGELDHGLEYLTQQNPTLDEYQIQTAREQYAELREALLEMDREALEILTRTPFRLANLFGLPTR